LGRSNWIRSVAGAKEVTVEMLPGSNLSNVLADLGYDLQPEADGEKILPTALHEPMVINPRWKLGPDDAG
jgi:hypothetical protein